jgi:hypothetical protein
MHAGLDNHAGTCTKRSNSTRQPPTPNTSGNCVGLLHMAALLDTEARTFCGASGCVVAKRRPETHPDDSNGLLRRLLLLLLLLLGGAAASLPPLVDAAAAAASCRALLPQLLPLKVDGRPLMRVSAVAAAARTHVSAAGDACTRCMCESPTHRLL